MKETVKKIFKNRIFVTFAAVILVVALLALSFVCVTNAVIITSTDDKILSVDEAAELDGVDCILVLGCGLRSDGSPSDMLNDRLAVGTSLYKSGNFRAILMSGDHGRVEYDEVGAMKNFALAQNIPSTDIFMDHAGFSTYESMYRAKEIFGADKIIVVTQGYHLPRALYIASSLGIEAYGVSADVRSYRGQIIRDARELLARSKDFLYTLTKPLPTYLGEPVSLDADGNVTNG
ncbi:MAG: YdcF family protein [Clostridia bacterium]|nr:YdcF family protein [Clostridia bacterium]